MYLTKAYEQLKCLGRQISSAGINNPLVWFGRIVVDFFQNYAPFSHIGVRNKAVSKCDDPFVNCSQHCAWKLVSLRQSYLSAPIWEIAAKKAARISNHRRIVATTVHTIWVLIVVPKPCKTNSIASRLMSLSNIAVK